MGRADAAGLHLRYQGARPDDRPADRGEAPAEGPPRGAARSSSPRSHGSTPRTCPTTIRDEVWERFVDALQPLAEAGQLGSILLQYPRWFFTSSENRDTIEDATGRLKDAGLVGAVEFRSASWFNEKNLERTLAFLGDREIPLVVVDGPQGFKSSVPAITDVPSRTWPSSASTAGGPRPGRRPASRPSSGSATCTTTASSGSGSRASEIADQAEEVHVLFNNCYANYGSTNALQMANLLDDLREG